MSGPVFSALPKEVTGLNWVHARMPKQVSAETPTAHNFWMCNRSVGTFDQTVIQNELDVLADLGVRYVRVFLSYYAYIIDRAEFTATLTILNTELQSRGMKCLLVLLEGVQTEIAMNPSEGDPRREPWYDYLNSNSWNPAASTNPALVTALNQITETQGNSTSWDNLHPMLYGGGWIGGPGPLYMTGFDHTQVVFPTYPGSIFGAKHTVLAQSIQSYVTTAVSALFNTIWAVDLCNEPHFSAVAGFAARQDANVLAEFGSITLAEAESRVYSYLAWWYDWFRTVFPTIPLTHGEVAPDYWALAALKGIQPDFWSCHLYGNGFEQTDLQVVNNIASLLPSTVDDVLMSEFWTTNTGEDHVLQFMYYLQENQIGGMCWEYFSTPGFLLDPSPVSWDPSPAEAVDYSYPNTGIAFSYMSSGTHYIQKRRQDLEYPLEIYWSGASMPRRYDFRIELQDSAGGYLFLIDEGSGQRMDDLFASDYPGYRVFWRYRVVSTTPNQTRSRRQESRFVERLPVVGDQVDGSITAVSQVGSGADRLAIPVDPATLPIGTSLLVTAAYSLTNATDFNINNYLDMQYNPVVEKYLSGPEVWGDEDFTGMNQLGFVDRVSVRPRVFNRTNSFTKRS